MSRTPRPILDAAAGNMLVMIALHQDKPCPTNTEIMEWTGVPRRRLKAYLESLVARGVIEIEFEGLLAEPAADAGAEHAMDGLDAPRQGDSTGTGPLVLTADKVMRDLEEVRLAAVAAGAFAPALRCIELQGKHIGLWTGDAAPERSLEQLLVEAAKPPGEP